MSAAWFCEAHRLTTTTDCPKCDDGQIADLEQYAKTPVCQVCQRSLAVGESAWASDWIVIEADGARRETRYTCDECDQLARMRARAAAAWEAAAQPQPHVDPRRDAAADHAAEMRADRRAYELAQLEDREEWA